MLIAVLIVLFLIFLFIVLPHLFYGVMFLLDTMFGAMMSAMINLIGIAGILLTVIMMIAFVYIFVKGIKKVRAK